jgi:hypothetical protein
MSNTCRWCGMPIRWVTTERGRRMCLDPEPTSVGNVALVTTADGLRARALATAELAEWRGPLWLPHMASCSHVTTRTGTKRQI